MNNELKSRREFFKKAAQSALPIIGAVVLASNPVIAKAAELPNTSCTGTCHGQCHGSCRNTCLYTCRDTCKNTCKGSCRSSSKK